jgi:hypothetical protein
VICREDFRAYLPSTENKVGPKFPPAGSCHWAELVPQTGNTTEHHADRVDLSRESLRDLIPLPPSDQPQIAGGGRVDIEQSVPRI